MGKPETLDWHATDGARVAAHLDLDPARGLDDAEAAARLVRFGANLPAARRERGPLRRFAAQLGQPLVLVLIGAGAVTASLGEWVDTSVILGVVLVNAVVGFIQEGKAEAALAALSRAVAAEATVLREGKRLRIPAAGLVPGDMVLLATGDKVPADLRLLSGKELRAAEAALTGESLPVAKCMAPLPTDTPLGDRLNMAYAGTLIVSGQGVGVVVATGEATQTGRISRLIAEAPDLATPLTRKMVVFAHRLLVAILTLAGLTFAAGVLHGQSAFDMFMAAVALAVAAIPEGLPAAITITLAMGVARMARRRAIIRRLPAVEALGSTTVICSDKTGTLTENAMTVREIWAGGERFEVTGHGYGPAGRIEAGGLARAPAGALRETLLAGALCNDARLVREGGHWTVAGDPTEGALLAAARKGELDEATLNAVFPRIDELPFDASRQYMATLHEIEGGRVVYAKGAAERLLSGCAAMLDAEGRETVLDAHRVEAVARAMAEEGMRVLALARSELAPGHDLGHARIERGLVFLGLVGMIDPPRPQAITSVRTCHAAGIRVKMVTGDHPGTAIAIAHLLGMVRDDAPALTGREIATLDDEALRRAVADTDVFARIEPEQKLRLVQALQANGEVVAMTGDGVNDAPALKQADIGVAMGLGGTEVAKEAAAMVLTDDNFATIEAAVEEGRGIFDNLIKFITWTMPTNAAEGLVILIAVLAGGVLPISALQILWINMTTAVLLGMMLAFEPAESEIMRRPPRPPAAPILDAALIRRTLLVAMLMLVGAFGVFHATLQAGAAIAEARTAAANMFVVMETVYLFNCRSLARPAWSVGLFSNPWAWAGSGAMIGLQLAFTYLPGFNRVFQTAPIGPGAWGAIIAFALASVVMVEWEKRWQTARPRRAARA